MLIGNGDYGDRDGGETELRRTMPREAELVPVTADTRVVTETSRRYQFGGSISTYIRVQSHISPQT